MSGTLTVWGTINGDGSIAAGTGYSVTAQGNGEYIISFSPTFSGTPAIVGSQVLYGSGSENTLDNVIFPYLNNGAATAKTGDSNGNSTNRAFSFIAMGLS